MSAAKVAPTSCSRSSWETLSKIGREEAEEAVVSLCEALAALAGLSWLVPSNLAAS
jgi:hypothetical protein